jgi:hypothetical protein
MMVASLSDSLVASCSGAGARCRRSADSCVAVVAVLCLAYSWLSVPAKRTYVHPVSSAAQLRVAGVITVLM